ncbi:MAG TPA: damage-control phosphatase ARMT1 family protein, partial [Anaerolineae bacterium]|nr:damage-control phosphatase ARMT1 family protein [Anaerolineae bacterium]
MTRPHIPPPRIDLATLPPLLSTGDPNSFAQFTFKVRDPRILQDLEDAPWFSPDLKHAFKKFRHEILEGAIQSLREDAPDTEFWQTISKPYIGRSWLDVPWYWAETFFYRRILEIVGYFQMGAWHERDPFAPQKDAELAPEVAPKRVSQLLQSLPEDPTLHFERILSAAMWGNRVDLSYNVERTVGRAERFEDERANLLVDDAERVWKLFSNGKIKRLVYVADNAGTELALDLALIDWLFEIHRIEKLTLHLKPQPFYVSDAMPQDVEHTLAAFEQANDDTRALAKRLRARLTSDQFELRVHWFYPTPLHYFEAPDDLFALFRAADFIILKGD